MIRDNKDCMPELQQRPSVRGSTSTRDHNFYPIQLTISQLGAVETSKPHAQVPRQLKQQME